MNKGNDKQNELERLIGGWIKLVTRQIQEPLKHKTVIDLGLKVK